MAVTTRRTTTTPESIDTTTTHRTWAGLPIYSLTVSVTTVTGHIDTIEKSTSVIANIAEVIASTSTIVSGDVTTVSDADITAAAVTGRTEWTNPAGGIQTPSHDGAAKVIVNGAHQFASDAGRPADRARAIASNHLLR